MPTQITMPALSPMMEGGTLARWRAGALARPRTAAI